MVKTTDKYIYIFILSLIVKVIGQLLTRPLRAIEEVLVILQSKEGILQ